MGYAPEFKKQGEYNPLDLIAGDFPLKSESITIEAGQVLRRGSVLGKKTAGGKFVLSAKLTDDDKPVADGSEKPLRILAEDIDSTGGGEYEVTGDLTIRDVTKSVTLDATLSAPVKTPWGNQARAAKVTGKIKRGDFGLKWNKALEAGGVVVGEEVTLNINAEVTK